MDYPIKITREKYYKAMLKVANCFLDMTELELDLIAYMFTYQMITLGKSERIKLGSLLNISIANLNNYIKKLRDKGILVVDGKDLIVNSNIHNQIIDGSFSVKFEIGE